MEGSEESTATSKNRLTLLFQAKSSPSIRSINYYTPAKYEWIMPEIQVPTVTIKPQPHAQHRNASGVNPVQCHDHDAH